MKKTIISYDSKIVHGQGQQVGYDIRESKTVVEVTNCTPEEHTQAREELKTIKASIGHHNESFRFLHIDADSFRAEIDIYVVDVLEEKGYSF